MNSVSSPSLLPGGWKAGLESSNCLGLYSDQSFQEATKRCLTRERHAYDPEILRVLGALYLGTGPKARQL